METLITEPKVSITFKPHGAQINVGNGVGPDNLMLAAALLTRAANQMLDAMEMQQAQAASMAQQIMREKR